MCITMQPCTDLIKEDGTSMRCSSLCCTLTYLSCTPSLPQGSFHKHMLFPTRKPTNKPQKKVEGFAARLPNCDIFSSSKLHRYFITLSSACRELESEACVGGVIHNRKGFLAVYDEMLQERVPFKDHDSIALLRAAAVLNAEHRSACLHRAIVLKRTSAFRSKNQSIKNATSNSRATPMEDTFQARRRLKLHYTQVLQHWIENHPAHPFPTKAEKIDLCHKASITEKQLNNWFTNYRRRHPQTN